MPDNVAQQPAYNAQVGLPATPISSPGTTGAMPSQAASSSSKRRRPALLIALLGILVFVLVGEGVLAFVLYQNSLPTPAKTLDAFCNALQGSDYTSAYNQLSDNLKGKAPEPIFANFFAKVSSCSYAAPNVTGKSATLRNRQEGEGIPRGGSTRPLQSPSTRPLVNI